MTAASDKRGLGDILRPLCRQRCGARQCHLESDRRAGGAGRHAPELAVNGLRAGVVGSQVPAELARLLTLTDQPQARDQENTVNLEAEPAVNLRLLSVRPGQRSEIVASNTYDELPLLMREGKHSSARPTTRPSAGSDCRRHRPRTIACHSTCCPRLNYGEPQHRWTGTDGGNPTRVHPSQAAVRGGPAATGRVRTGQMLMPHCRPERPGSLGHYYFTESKAERGIRKEF